MRLIVAFQLSTKYVQVWFHKYFVGKYNLIAYKLVLDIFEEGFERSLKQGFDRNKRSRVSFVEFSNHLLATQ